MLIDNSLKNIQENTIESNKKKCIFVFAEDGKYGISKLFKPLDSVFDGAGWWIKDTYMDQVKSLCHQANMTYFESELPADNFDSFRRKNSLSYYESQIEELSQEIENLKLKLTINFDLNEIVSDESKLQTLTNQECKDLIHKYKIVDKKIKRIKNEELIANISQQNSAINIQFINTQAINSLLVDAPEMPKLINTINDEGKISPFIRKGIVGQIVGAGGIGKTHFLTQLALSIASGIKFLNEYPIEKPGNVFLVLGENSNEDIQRLLRKTYKALVSFHQDEQVLIKAGDRLAVMSVTGVDAAFINRDGFPTEFYLNLLNELKSKEPQDGWACIIFDPISRFLGADAENDNAAATRAISLLEKITLELKGKPTVLFGHHMSKSGLTKTDTDQTAARGSSAITDGVRLQINLEKVAKANPQNEDDKFEHNKIKMRVVKSNHTLLHAPKVLLKDDFGCLVVDEIFVPATSINKEINLEEQYIPKRISI
jgi:RecA-family ATPase